jgi:hypothetical protein
MDVSLVDLKMIYLQGHQVLYLFHPFGLQKSLALILGGTLDKIHNGLAEGDAAPQAAVKDLVPLQGNIDAGTMEKWNGNMPRAFDQADVAKINAARQKIQLDGINMTNVIGELRSALIKIVPQHHGEHEPKQKGESRHRQKASQRDP